MIFRSLKIKGIFLFILLLACPVFSQNKELKRKKVGIVFNGGGAKGAAHIGVLKVLKKAGIPIDYVAGTSMGAIVGGLYSIGYTPHQLDSTIRNQDWDYLLRDKVYRRDFFGYNRQKDINYLINFLINKDKTISIQALCKGQNVQNLLSTLTIGYHGNTNFQKYPIPFACTATDIEHYQEHDFLNGNLPQAIRASMSIPGFFVPIKIDSMILVDGGVMNNYPANLVRKMGADVVIGIDFYTKPTHQPYSSINYYSIVPILENFINDNLKEKNLENTDLHIRVDVTPYGTFSFDKHAIEDIIKKGEDEAMKKWDKIIAFRNTLGLDSIGIQIDSVQPYPYLNKEKIKINSIRLEGIYPNEKRVIEKYLKNINRITRKELNRKISMFYSSDFFETVYYQLVNPQNGGFDLVIIFDRKKETDISFTMRYDTESYLSSLFHTDFQFVRKNRVSMLGITAKLSRDYSLKAQMFIGNFFSLRGGLGYLFRHQEFDLYSKMDKISHISYIKNNLNLTLFDYKFSNCYFSIGSDVSYYNFKNSVRNLKQKIIIPSKLYISYWTQFKIDNLDKIFLPQKGFFLNAKYNIYTDNFYQLNKRAPLSAFEFESFCPIKITDKFHLVPKVQLRSVITNNTEVPLIFSNIAGGYFDGQLTCSQFKMNGTHRAVLLNNFVFENELEFRYNFNKDNALQLIVSDLGIKELNNKFSHHLGSTLRFSANKFFGPMYIDLGYSDLTNSFSFGVSMGYDF